MFTTVNVPTKKSRMEMIQQTPDNLQVSVSPGALTGIGLPTMTSSVENTSEICFLLPRKRLALRRYLSRDTAIAPDLEQPEA